MKVLQLEQINANDLLSQVQEIVKNEVKKIAKNTTTQETELMTRQQVADFFSVSLVTIHHWNKKGIIKPFRIGKKVRYKKHQIINALQDMSK